MKKVFYERMIGKKRYFPIFYQGYPTVAFLHQRHWSLWYIFCMIYIYADFIKQAISVNLHCILIDPDSLYTGDKGGVAESR